MFMACAHQVPDLVYMYRANRKTGAIELGRQYLCQPLLLNG